MYWELSQYSAHVHINKITSYLLNLMSNNNCNNICCLLQVKVYRVDDVQGEEFRALIVSTVRTCTKEPPPEEDAGFLTNAKVSVILVHDLLAQGYIRCRSLYGLHY